MAQRCTHNYHNVASDYVEPIGNPLLEPDDSINTPACVSRVLLFQDILVFVKTELKRANATNTLIGATYAKQFVWVHHRVCEFLHIDKVEERSDYSIALEVCLALRWTTLAIYGALRFHVAEVDYECVYQRVSDTAVVVPFYLLKRAICAADSALVRAVEREFGTSMYGELKSFYMHTGLPIGTHCLIRPYGTPHRRSHDPAPQATKTGDAATDAAVQAMLNAQAELRPEFKANEPREHHFDTVPLEQTRLFIDALYCADNVCYVERHARVSPTLHYALHILPGVADALVSASNIRGLFVPPVPWLPTQADEYEQCRQMVRLCAMLNEMASGRAMLLLNKDKFGFRDDGESLKQLESAQTNLGVAMGRWQALAQCARYNAIKYDEVAALATMMRSRSQESVNRASSSSSSNNNTDSRAEFKVPSGKRHAPDSSDAAAAAASADK
jgi:hypothetical protein